MTRYIDEKCGMQLKLPPRLIILSDGCLLAVYLTQVSSETQFPSSPGLRVLSDDRSPDTLTQYSLDKTVRSAKPCEKKILRLIRSWQ
ncbi:hypothetical protein [Microcoleus sp. bin38.metabat.b11b12b14.051]|uniref:hypothetical protein n=1 Tax=Microcoleus sp. bin38.metabat.b11b12b14.051 TaxID=2742709 RepID=UPI0025D050A7|nr:hypothetical protein [Microcoleus sp. bin38.metabat.b11b12b14.051]